MNAEENRNDPYSHGDRFPRISYSPLAPRGRDLRIVALVRHNQCNILKNDCRSICMFFKVSRMVFLEFLFFND